MADKSRGRVATAESPVIDAVCARVRERVDGELAEGAEEFARQYYGHLPAEDLAERDPLDLYGAALAHLDFGRHREPGETKVRVYNPEFDQHGWKSTHTVAEIVSDDMPFLVDSVSMELSRLGA